VALQDHRNRANTHLKTLLRRTTNRGQKMDRP
jgi:hypothetical protein